MPVINNPFNGKMNLDVAEYRIDGGDYIDAMNITRDAQGVGQDRVISNVLGNTLIPYTLPSGINKIIGFFPDKIKNRAYYFLYNTNGYNSIIYYDLSNNTVVKVLESKTDSDGIDILNFNPSYKVTSVNIFYRENEGDLLFFNDGLNPPKYINVTEYHGTSWKLEYILVAKAPPIMPPKVVYENDTTVTTNNLRNVLFQFSYRYVYLNNEKSVWSTNSIVPLPQQDALLLTNDSRFTNNSRISVSVSTGGLDVRAIEIAFRETTNGVTSDWFLIQSFNKANLNIDNNNIYTYNFYNDGIYTPIDILETTQLQDWVPQKANASELANGNVLLYAGITEGYDKTKMNIISSSYQQNSGYYYDKSGLLFFATCNGIDSNSDGNILKIYIFGTGTNVNNRVETLNNAGGIFTVNIHDSFGDEIGASYENSFSEFASVYTILIGISNALTTSGNGWTEVSIIDNVLILSNTNKFKLLSSGVKILFPADETNNSVFANSWSSGYQYALQYFDSLGKTIGAQTDINASFNTPASDGFKYPITEVSIKNRPPLEAKYYQVLRSNNTTYNKRLFWISESAYSSNTYDTTIQRFAYIGIKNIQEYNDSITSTQGVVSYNFVAGDRIKFLKRYNASNNPVDITVVDYEILGTVSSITTADGTVKTGNFIKILYPTYDISDNFKFDGTENFLHYEIFLYNFINNSSTTQRLFYEFGKCFGIGNSGTELAYHIGLEQTQSPSDPEGVPAIVSATNGDLFYRKRKVPFSDSYNLSVDSATYSATSTFTINVPVTITNTIYTLKQQTGHLFDITGTYPDHNSTDNLFQNNLTNVNDTVVVKASGSFSCFQSGTTNANVRVYAIVCANEYPFSARKVIELNEFKIIPPSLQTEVIFDATINVPPTGKLWFGIGTDASIDVSAFILNFNVLKNKTIDIIESSFTDTYNLVTNSNGRPSLVDTNAKKTYFPTLIRFGGAYQVDTNINRLNNFIYENFDEYDRSFGDVIRLHVRERYLKVYQKFKVGNVPIYTQIIKDSVNNPLQANTDKLINKIQYYAGDYGIGDAATSLAWNNFADYFVDNYRGVVCRLSQDGIVPISITNNTNAFFVPILTQYRQELNNGIPAQGQPYMGNPCIYGVFDAYTNKYILGLEEINRYTWGCNYNGGTAVEVVVHCGYNGGTANKQISQCSYNGGTVIVIGTCDFRGGTATI